MVKYAVVEFAHSSSQSESRLAALTNKKERIKTSDTFNIVKQSEFRIYR
jgi:hypothetical protein